MADADYEALEALYDDLYDDWEKCEKRIKELEQQLRLIRLSLGDDYGEDIPDFIRHLRQENARLQEVLGGLYLVVKYYGFPDGTAAGDDIAEQLEIARQTLATE